MYTSKRNCDQIDELICDLLCIEFDDIEFEISESMRQSYANKLFNRNPMLRWHTFKVVLLTSLVWVIFWLCLLVYYMDCLGGNTNCGRSVGAKFIAFPGSNQNDDNSLSQSNNHQVVRSAHRSSLLPPYKPSQLRQWELPG